MPVARHGTVGYHRAVKNGAAKLARRAVAEKIGGPELSKLIRSEHGAAHTGRKPKNEIQRRLDAAKRALVSSILEAALEPSKIRALPQDLRARLQHDVRTLRERIELVGDALSGRRG
jgi:hypothetical protein